MRPAGTGTLYLTPPHLAPRPSVFILLVVVLLLLTLIELALVV